MFTFGIFTTHIPYVAFVVFYAYFLIFGVEKVSKGEIQGPGNAFKTELQATKIISLNNYSNFSYQTETSLAEHSNSAIFLFKRKIKHRIKFITHYYPVEFFISLSNRPPPVLV